MSVPTLGELVNRFWDAPDNAEWKPKKDVIPRADLDEWIKSEDMEVLGFLNAMIHDHRFRFDPPIDICDYVAFVQLYYGRCFRESPEGEWSKGRFVAGWDIVGIFCTLWDGKVSRKILIDLKTWLADIYRKGDCDVRYCLETATLEHLFERPAIRRFFSDWKDDDVLRPAYENALLLVKGGGKTPLSRKRGN